MARQTAQVTTTAAGVTHKAYKKNIEKSFRRRQPRHSLARDRLHGLRLRGRCVWQQAMLRGQVASEQERPTGVTPRGRAPSCVHVRVCCPGAHGGFAFGSYSVECRWTAAKTGGNCCCRCCRLLPPHGPGRRRHAGEPAREDRRQRFEPTLARHGNLLSSPFFPALYE